MPASPTSYASTDFMVSGSLQPLNEPEALALQLLVEKRARQRDLQRDIAVKAGKMLAELGTQARAADLDLLVTLLELAAAEAERECDRWGEAAG
ncbi:hypothetical protein QO058_00700 [Bosea vestrisii]|uniref:hypothetical protein n=1 Tax=Bosea vestrisii TaxID=151416 RepID=UPI0024DFE85D|nr:hypothetical protein [Bosea vestrisii]WID96849.1 hypothetical protein QO058_00700 [Bosea vestrisii]